MSRTLFRAVALAYLRHWAAIFVAVLAIYLVADFVDRAKSYTGPHWMVNALVLYGYKALVTARQLAPASLLIGAGAAVSSLRRTGEVTAMRSLTLGPWALYAPIGAVALVISLALVAFDEVWVVKAGQRVDEITLQRFGGWGDWRFYNTPKQWFRTGDRIIHLRGGGSQEGYNEVTLLRMTPEFRLEQRIDARLMRFAGGTRWRLVDAVERTFDQRGGTALRRLPELVVDLGVDGEAFIIRQGRPEQMRIPELEEQIGNREAVGLPVAQYVLALHNRFAYPLAGLPAALLAVGLALRPGRKGHLTVALVEGLTVVMVLWGMMVIARALVVGERIGAGVAAWLPVIVLVVSASGLWLRREGRLGWRGS